MNEHDVAKTDEYADLALHAATTCDLNKGHNIALYDLKESSLLADFYLICSGTSEPHISSLADHIEKAMLEKGSRPRHIDGSPASRWIVMDYGFLMVHIFHPDLRQYYEIEKLWRDTSEVIFSGGDEASEAVPVF